VAGEEGGSVSSARPAGSTSAGSGPAPAATPAGAGAISVQETAYVARLARLELAPEELERFAGELSAILEHVEAVRRLDTADVPPMAHVVDLRNVLRPDKVRPCLDRDEVLAAAPQAESGRFRVPRILGEEP
jgi:aspartyl-tRNA(Asn)/glutamyl-tRNA(Gln) amidotransferase subunit C